MAYYPVAVAAPVVVPQTVVVPQHVAVPAQPQVVTPAPVVPMPPPHSGLTPQNEIEREAVRMVLAELRKKNSSQPADVARVTVRLPAEARLIVDNVLCPLTSEVRAFNTPKLEPGRQYYYTVRMELNRAGQVVAENRRVVLSAGQQVEVDFNASVVAARR